MAQKIVIVGGVAGGASAAARARRLSESAEIIVLERGPYVSFANCGLPYHIGGDIKNREALLLQTPQSFKRRFNVDVRVGSEVVAIDRARKAVTVRRLATGDSYQQPYDQLILSPGAAPIVPPIDGIDNPLTFSLRNIPDMDRILARMQQQMPQHATVVGGGFIGLEMAEALHQRGIRVTLLELAPQVMAPIDGEMATLVHDELRSHGIDLRLATALSGVAMQGDDGLLLTTSHGEQLTTNMLILAIGVRPDVSLARAAGLALGPLGGIAVNDQMLTSDPAIYAVGDAVETPDFITGKPSLVPLAGPANRQGRIVADNIFGRPSRYLKTQGTAIVRVFSLAVASTGLSEKALLRQQLPYHKIYVVPGSHAGYFPGAHPVTLKLLFAPDTGRILGAQAVGRDGIDKRIDVLAVALRAGLTVFDLEHLELCYAPPYGSAKDVVNLAGFVASNLLRGDSAICHVTDILQRSSQQQVLDVRSPAELAQHGSIAGAINIPVDELRDRLGELDRSKEYLVTCQVGLRGHVAQRMLVNSGFEARNLSGGFRIWQLVMGQLNPPTA